MIPNTIEGLQAALDDKDYFAGDDLTGVDPDTCGKARAMRDLELGPQLTVDEGLDLSG